MSRCSFGQTVCEAPATWERTVDDPTDPDEAPSWMTRVFCDAHKHALMDMDAAYTESGLRIKWAPITSSCDDPEN